MMKQVLLLEFSAVKFTKLFEKLTQNLMSKEPITKEVPQSNLFFMLGSKRPGEDSDTFKGRNGEKKKGSKSKFQANKNNNDESGKGKGGTDREGKPKTGCSFCGDLRYREDNCWKKHPELIPRRGGPNNKPHRQPQTHPAPQYVHMN